MKNTDSRSLRLSLCCKVILTALALSGCRTVANETTVLRGYVSSDDQVFWPGGVIDVCWENDGPGMADGKALVRSVIEEQFNGRTKLKYTGWGLCTANSKGLRVIVYDGISAPDALAPAPSEGGFGNTSAFPAHPQTHGIGHELAGQPNGMLLNFGFKGVQKNLADACFGKSVEMTKLCIRNVAIHEFGHAAGLLHEHERFDSTCQLDSFPHEELPEFETRGYFIGPFDEKSVMNYCVSRVKVSKEALVLSDGDIQTIDWIYSQVATGNVPSPAPSQRPPFYLPPCGCAFKDSDPPAVVLTQVTDTGSAKIAGFRAGDVIVDVDGTQPQTVTEFFEALKKAFKAGTTPTVVVKRGMTNFQAPLALKVGNAANGGS